MSDVLHHARPTETQRAARFHQAQFRADIEARAEARKIVPLVCLAKPLVVRVIQADEIFGPRIQTPDEIAFGPIVIRKPVEPKIPDIKLITVIVCRFYEVAMMDLISARRTAEIVRPRQVAMYLSKTLTLKSLPEIGRRFGGRDHTTVLHAVRKIEGLVEYECRLSDEIEVLKLLVREAVLNK